MTLSHLQAYHAAMRADDAFADAIRQAFGKRATRWTVDVHAHALTDAAYNAKREADDVLHAEMVAMRTR